MLSTVVLVSLRSKRHRVLLMNLLVVVSLIAQQTFVKVG